MSKIARTQKEFCKENMPLDFLRRALAIAGLDSCVLKYELEDFIIEESWEGDTGNGSVSPWRDEFAEKGWIKTRSNTDIKHTRGFDTFAVIFCKHARIQGYYKDSFKNQYTPDSVKWVNLLLEYDFVEIVTD